jgi:hypothetical protein
MPRHATPCHAMPSSIRRLTILSPSLVPDDVAGASATRCRVLRRRTHQPAAYPRSDRDETRGAGEGSERGAAVRHTPPCGLTLGTLSSLSPPTGHSPPASRQCSLLTLTTAAHYHPMSRERSLLSLTRAQLHCAAASRVHSSPSPPLVPGHVDVFSLTIILHCHVVDVCCRWGVQRATLPHHPWSLVTWLCAADGACSSPPSLTTPGPWSRGCVLQMGRAARHQLGADARGLLLVRRALPAPP